MNPTGRRVEAEAVIGGLVRIGQHLNAATDLRARIEALCAETAAMLGCDRSSVMMRDGAYYRGTYNFGNPPDIARHFRKYRVRADAPLIEQIMSTGSYVLVNDVSTSGAVGSVAERARITSLVLAPLFDVDGSGLAFMTAEYNEQVADFSELHAQLVLGAARLAQSAILGEREHRLRRRAEQTRQRLLEELLVAEDHERRRLGRSLEDQPVEQLAELAMGLQRAHSLATDPTLAVALSALIDRTHEVIGCLKGIVQDVHPLTLEADGLAEALGAALARHAEQRGWRTHFENRLEAEPSPSAGNVLYRIALQGLRATALYGDASLLNLQLESDAGGTRLTISHDGGGFDVTSAPMAHLGLASMWERAEYAGGRCIVNSSPHGGAVITVWVPDTR